MRVFSAPYTRTGPGGITINMSECVKIWYFQRYKNFLGMGHSSLSRPFPQWGGAGAYPLPTSHPLGACGVSTPPILKSWVRHCLKCLEVILVLVKNKTQHETCQQLLVRHTQT